LTANISKMVSFTCQSARQELSKV